MKTIIVLIIVGLIAFYSLKSLIGVLSGKNPGCDCASAKNGGCNMTTCQHYKNIGNDDNT